MVTRFCNAIYFRSFRSFGPGFLPVFFLLIPSQLFLATLVRENQIFSSETKGAVEGRFPPSVNREVLMTIAAEIINFNFPSQMKLPRDFHEFEASRDPRRRQTNASKQTPKMSFYGSDASRHPGGVNVARTPLKWARLGKWLTNVSDSVKK